MLVNETFRQVGTSGFGVTEPWRSQTGASFVLVSTYISGGFDHLMDTVGDIN